MNAMEQDEEEKEEEGRKREGVAGKGLTSRLSFVLSSCDVVHFPLVSWVRCGVCLYLFLILALFLTLRRRGGGGQEKEIF